MNLYSFIDGSHVSTGLEDTNVCDVIRREPFITHLVKEIKGFFIAAMNMCVFDVKNVKRQGYPSKKVVCQLIHKRHNNHMM